MMIKNRISEVRLKHGITQAQLAAQIGTSTRMIGFIENGERPISLKTIYKIARLFNCSIDYLLYMSEYINDAIINKANKDFDIVINKCVQEKIEPSQILKFIDFLSNLDK